MTEQEAMDETTLVSVKDAIREIKKHGFDAFEGGGVLMAHGQGIMIPEIVCNIHVGDECSSLKILEWLGY